MATPLTNDEINDLMKDWFVRDSETYTRITAEHRLAWEPTNGSAYSTILIGTKHTTDSVIRKAYAIARNMLISMNVKKFTLHIDKTNNSTDGKHIWVATEVFDKKYLPVPEAIDVFLGATVHEGLHVLETDFDYVRPTGRGYSEAELKFIHTLGNILEDERIEMIAGETHPGTVKYLEKTKYYYFDLQRQKAEEFRIANKLDPSKPSNLEKCFNTICSIIRYPKHLVKEDFEFFGSRLKDIKELLTPYPTNTYEVLEASRSIYEILKELIVEELESNFKKQKEAQEAFEKMLDAFKEFLENVMTKSGDVTDSGKLPDGVACSNQIEKFTDDILNENLEEGELPRTYILRAGEDSEQYARDLQTVRPYLSAVRKALRYHAKDFKVTHKSMRNGYLDTSKIVEATLGVDTVYETYGEVKTDKVAVCFLIDLSGSMMGDSIQAARETSILLWEALKGNPSIELFIYGHTADDERGNHTTDIYVFHEPGSRHNKKHALGSVDAHACNRDGDAIEECSLRIRKRTQRKCLMFVLSDGNPNASGYGSDVGVRKTRESVLKVQRRNIEVVQIAINHEVEPERMFDKYVILDNLDTLPRDLNRLIKKTLLNKQKIHVS